MRIALLLWKRSSSQRQRAAGGLSAEATEFSPGLPMAEVLAAWNAVCEQAATVGGTTTIHALSLKMYRRSEAE